MLSRLKLPTMISIITVCFIAITAASLAYIVSGTLFEDAEHNAATREGFALRTAATLIEQRIHGTHVDWSGSTIRRIIVPDVSELGDNTLVDDVSRITGGAATLFVFNREKNDFVRVSTSVKKADGTRAIGTWLGNTGPVFPVVREGNTYAGEALILNIPYYTIYQPFYDPNGVVSGILFAGVQKSEVIETANQLVRSLILTSCGLVLVLSLCAYFAVRRITRPLLVLAFTINRITQNGAITVPYTNYRNEIGAIASAMKIFRETLLEANSLRVEQIDNEKKSELVRRDGMVSIAARIRKSVGVIVEQLKLLSHQAQDATVQMQGNADVATRRVERALFDLKNASSDVTLVATAVSELSASSNDISVRTSHTVVATRTALSSGHAAGEIATKLSQATHYIANISSLIGKIASQTNLLALNATIEAARAGEAGRGFAVVASEVKVLAEQTARATDDIDRHVAEIGQITASVVAAISEMNSSIDTATSTTVSIAAAVQEQSAATGDISQSIQRAAAGTLNVIEGIADLPELAHRIQDAAGSLCTVNDALGEQARMLSTEIDRLLQELTDCHVIERLEGSERAVARG